MKNNIKAYLCWDEWYPVFYIETGRTYKDKEAIDIPEDLIREHNRVMEAFNILQDKLDLLYEQQKN